MLLLCGLFVLSFGLVARGATSVLDQDAALIYEHPYVVSLEYRGQHVCGGSILNDQWILTAAHCLENRTADLFKIAAGSSDLATSTLYSVEALVSHKNFTYAPDPSYIAVGDIGLVRVNGTIHFSRRVLPIALHRQNTIDDQVLGKFAGWGPSQAANASDVNQLRITELFFPALENCSKLNPRYFNPDVSCTVPISDDPEACDYYVGGGGGPLVFNDSLVGVALRMDNCNGTGPSYTRVWHYKQWIESTMKDWKNQENQTIDYSTYPPYSTPQPTTRYPPYSTPRPTTRYPPYSTPRPTTRYPPYSTPWPTTKYPTYPPHNTTYPSYPPHNTTYPPYPWHNATTGRPGKKINIQFYFSMSGNGTISFPN